VRPPAPGGQDGHRPGGPAGRVGRGPGTAGPDRARESRARGGSRMSWRPAAVAGWRSRSSGPGRACSATGNARRPTRTAICGRSGCIRHEESLPPADDELPAFQLSQLEDQGKDRVPNPSAVRSATGLGTGPESRGGRQCLLGAGRPASAAARRGGDGVALGPDPVPGAGGVRAGRAGGGAVVTAVWNCQRPMTVWDVTEVVTGACRAMTTDDGTSVLVQGSGVCAQVLVSRLMVASTRSARPAGSPGGTSTSVKPCSRYTALWTAWKVRESA